MEDSKIRALKGYYSSLIDIRKSELQVYIDNPVAIGDHSNLIDTMDELVGKIADAEDKLIVLETHFSE
jgi:putative lipase involved disintegration of autophagic bodies